MTQQIKKKIAKERKVIPDPIDEDYSCVQDFWNRMSRGIRKGTCISQRLLELGSS